MGSWSGHYGQGRHGQGHLCGGHNGQGHHARGHGSRSSWSRSPTKLRKRKENRDTQTLFCYWQGVPIELRNSEVYFPCNSLVMDLAIVVTTTTRTSSTQGSPMVLWVIFECGQFWGKQKNFMPAIAGFLFVRKITEFSLTLSTMRSSRWKVKLMPGRHRDPPGSDFKLISENHCSCWLQRRHFDADSTL